MESDEKRNEHSKKCIKMNHEIVIARISNQNEIESFPLAKVADIPSRGECLNVW